VPHGLSIHDPQLLTPLRWDETAAELLILDQLKLPHAELWRRAATYEEVATAIRDMVVRGAPAIGIAAAYGVALAVRAGALPEIAIPHLAATRPTAVNLFWALERMKRRIAELRATGLLEPAMYPALLQEAQDIHEEDLRMCLAIGEYGAPLLPPGAVLTHCNAGALATGGYGTALGVIRSAVAAGTRLRVYADETRPYLQGARLTAWELLKSGIAVTLLTDGMAGHLMARGEIQSVVVGADRIARNGDVANKIGTYTLAVLCRAHHIPFYVAVPRSTLDLSIESGAQIPIEERSQDEVLSLAGVRIAPQGAAARHPAFDVTPAELVTAIITDVGVARPPYPQSLAALLAAPVAKSAS